MRKMQTFHPVFYLLVATLLEVSGDAVVRMGIVDPPAGAYRLGLLLLGAALLFGYGAFLNSAPLEFAEVFGLYVATLCVVWQIVTFAFFRTVPTLPVIVGSAMVVAGGLTITYWKT